MRKYIIKNSLILLLAMGLKSSAQQAPIENYPVIGKPCPDFVLKDIMNYDKKEVSLKDFKGKNLILDFWGKSCMACILSFPKDNEIQKTFDKDVQIFLVGAQDPEDHIHSLYKRLVERQKLILPSAFDSTLFKQFVPLGYVPMLIWIDKDGIVKAVTGVEDLTIFKVKAFVNGESFKFSDVSYDATIREQAVRVTGGPIKDVSSIKESIGYHSTLGLWKPGMPDSRVNVEIALSDPKLSLDGTKYEASKIGLVDLLGAAFLKQSDISSRGYYCSPIINVRDSSKFGGRGESLNEVKYYYRVEIPANSLDKDGFRRLIQLQLQGIFNYSVQIERRMLPCLNLKVVNKALAQSKRHRVENGPDKFSWEKGQGGRLYNVPMENLCGILASELPLPVNIFDETGIKENLDVEIDAVTSDLEDLRRSLRKSGLDLIKSERPLKVMVISDVNPISK